MNWTESAVKKPKYKNFGERGKREGSVKAPAARDSNKYK
jgi:hypothetical protein